MTVTENIKIITRLLQERNDRRKIFELVSGNKSKNL